MTKTHVLLVDDEELNLEILVEYFEGEEPFVLHTADSANPPGNCYSILKATSNLSCLTG